MRDRPTDFAADLEAGVTTHCLCWKVVRRDGIALGFTDHDRALHFDGLDYEPEGGFAASEARATAELSVDGTEVLGALSSDRLREDDIARGLYGGAQVEVWRVDWTDPDRRFHLAAYAIAEIRLRGAEFVAELRGPAARFDRPRGRLHRRLCDARLGDPRCGVDLEQSAWRGAGLVIESHGDGRFMASGLDAFDAGLFALGRLRWDGGPNVGLEAAVRDHGAALDGVLVVLDDAPLEPITPGDAFTIWAGCDKRLETCRDRFANTLNFRGFPYMPSQDLVLGRAR